MARFTGEARKEIHVALRGWEGSDWGNMCGAIERKKKGGEGVKTDFCERERERERDRETEREKMREREREREERERVCVCVCERERERERERGREREREILYTY